MLEKIPMKRSSTFLLRCAIIALALAVLAICVFVMPQMWMAVPGEYPAHAYVLYAILTAFYVAAIPFYIAAYQAMMLLNYIDTGKAFSMLSVTALKRIAWSATVISGVFAASMPCFYIWAQQTDAPGLVIIGMFLVFAPFTIAVFAALLQRLFHEAIEIKSENDLTV